PIIPREVEEVYPISDVQQGMLLHSIHAAEPGMYISQLSVRVHGLDLEKFKAAWRVVTRRHEALRSAFVEQAELGRHLQVVRARVSVPVEALDWRARSVSPEDLAALAGRERR